MNNFKKNLLKHCENYPNLEIEDVFKFIFQGAFGCEHMISSLDTATNRITNEYSHDIDSKNLLVEDLSEKYSRVHLSYISKGLSCSTLGMLFYLSAKKEAKGKEQLEKMLDIVKELTAHKLLPFSYDELIKKATNWKENGYCSLHHSNAFHSLYKPKYRVISREYIPFLDLLAKIDTLLKQDDLTIAIDGGSASGKTTLAALLNKIYDATVFHMDDFFLTPEMRTSERLCEVGGNVDRERFLSEVLLPLSHGSNIHYRPFDCSKGKIKKATIVTPKKLVIIEGAYSMHPELSKHYDFSVFLDIDKEKQIKRIKIRNSSQLSKRFFEEWIPLENIYFEKTDIKNRCDLIISV